MIKKWAVKSLAGVLEEYLEGVTPDSVETNLGQGILKLQKCRLKESALTPFNLKLKQSELEVDVEIPWTGLYTKHTIVKVGLKIEVEMSAVSSSSFSEAEKRARKKEEIEALEAKKKKAAEQGQAASPGMLTQLSHAILRLLVVKLDGVSGVVHPPPSRQKTDPQLLFGLSRARFESTASDYVSAPTKDQTDLYKALDIEGLSVEAKDPSRASPCQVLQPLKVEARLHHSPSEGVAELMLAMPHSATAVVTPTSLRCAQGCVDWYVEQQAAENQSGLLPEGAGREYALEYSRKLRGEDYSQEKLLEIEDLGSAAWVVEWRVFCKNQQEVAAKTNPPKYTWSSWFSGRSERNPVQADDILNSALDQAQQEGNLPTVKPPTKVQLKLQIPKAGLVLKDFKDLEELHLLAEGTGAVLAAHAEAASNHGTEEAVHLWQATTQVELASLTVHYDKEAIFEFRKVAERIVDDPQRRSLSAEDKALMAAVGAMDEQAIEPKCLSIAVCARQTGQAAWKVAVTVRKEPIVLTLAPWTINGVVAMAMQLYRILLATAEEVTPKRWSLYDGGAPDLPDNNPQDGDAEEFIVAAVKDVEFALLLDVVVKAPIVNFVLPLQGTYLTAHLGSLFAKTGKGDTAEYVSATALLLACELKDTRLAFQLPDHPGVISVFEPSTVTLLADSGSKDGQVSVDLSADVLNVRLDPGFSRILGQFKVAMEYALLPLTSLTEAEVATPTLIRASTSGTAIAREVASRLGGGAGSEPVQLLTGVNDQDGLSLSVAQASADADEVAKVKVTVTLNHGEAAWEPTSQTRTIVGRYERAKVEFQSYSKRSSCVVTAKALAFESGGVAIIGTKEDLQVDIAMLPKRLDVKIEVPVIMIQWIGTAVGELFDAGRQMTAGMQSGEQEASRTCPPGASQGMAFRLWNQYASELSSQLQANLETQLGKYGLAGDGAEIHIEQPSATSTATPAGDSSRSVHVGIVCKKFSLELWKNGHARSQSPQLAINATSLTGVFEYEASGRIDVNVALAALDFLLEERLLLARRSADTELLRVKVRGEPAPKSSTFVDFTWAQVAVMYRQRDLDAIMMLIFSEVVEVISPSQPAQDPLVKIEEQGQHEDKVIPDGEEVKEEELLSLDDFLDKRPEAHMTAKDSSENKSSFSYAVNVAAPLVFLPTDAAGGDGLAGRLRVGPNSLCEYEPAEGEGFAEIDFGRLEVRQGQKSGQVICQLEQAQAFNYIYSPRKEDGWKYQKLEVLRPLSFEVVVEIKSGGSFNVLVKVLLDDSNQDDALISLTRAQVTQWIDIIFLNFSYSIADARRPQAPLSRKPSQLEDVAQHRRDTVLVHAAERAKEMAKQSTSKPFMIKVQWEGRARLATMFTKDPSEEKDRERTQDTPIANLELEDGFLQLRGMNDGAIEVKIGCKSGAVIDKRKKSKKRNVSEQLLECAAPAIGQSLHVVIEIPKDPLKAMEVRVDLKRPTLVALPRLLMDLMTWALSTFQQSAQGKAAAAPTEPKITYSDRGTVHLVSSTEAAAAPGQEIHVVVAVPGAALRLVSDWQESENYFELRGNAVIQLSMKNGDLNINSIAVTEGELRRTHAAGLLCSQWSCEVSGSFHMEEDLGLKDRLGRLILNNITVPPLRIRLSVKDHIVLLQALTALGQMEAECVEPAEEIRARDPLSVVLSSRFQVEVAVNLQRLELQMIDDDSGKTARPAIEVVLSCSEFTADVMNGGTQVVPSVKCATKSDARLRVSSYNERIGAFEPVLQKSSWRLEFDVEEDKEAREARVELKLSSSPIQVLVTSAFTHLAARLGRALAGGDSASGGAHGAQRVCYTEMLVAFNICGCPCMVSTSAATDRSGEITVPPSGEEVSLESVLMDADRSAASSLDADRTSLPELCIRLPGIEEECMMELTGESTKEWHIGDGRVLLLRVVMPRPPQRLLVLCSPLVVINYLPVNAEVRYLDESGRPLPLSRCKDFCHSTSQQHGIRRWTGAALFQAGSGDIQVPREAMQAGATDADADLVPAGCLLSPPLGVQAQQLQVRPAPCAGLHYSWSEKQAYTTMLDRSSMVACKAAELDLPTLHMSVTARDAGSQDHSQYQVSLEAPFDIANACPSEIICIFRDNRDPAVWEELGVREEWVRGAATAVTVFDGYGRHRVVPPDGRTDSFPLRLAAARWSTDDNNDLTALQPGSRHMHADGMKVNRSGRKVIFTFLKHRGVKPKMGRVDGEVKIQAAEACPILDHEYEHTHFMLMLSQHDTGERTECSYPLPLAITEEFTCRLPCHGKFLPAVLGIKGGEGRRVVVFAQLWFANSTGLDVGLHAQLQRGKPLPLPTFGDSMALASEEEDTSFYLKAFDFEPVKVAVPSPGTSARVSLSEYHDCVVQTEVIAAGDTFGAPCHLFSVVPAVMAFSYVDGYTIGLRQEGGHPQHTVWLSADNLHAADSIWWMTPGARKRLQVAAYMFGMDVPEELLWSSPIELEEGGIGAFPMVLQQSDSERVVVCVQVDQSGSLFTVTIRDHASCHQLINRHPCLSLAASFCYFGTDGREKEDGDMSGQFFCEHGSTVALARNSQRWKEQTRLCLTLGDTAPAHTSTNVKLDLTRVGLYTVPPETFAVPASIFVELRGTVAIITVEPLRFIAGSQEELNWVTTFDLVLPSITLAVVGEVPVTKSKKKREEVLTVVLGDLRMSLVQRGTKSRDIIFNLEDLQVTLQRPEPVVILASVDSAPFLLAQTVREDLVSRVMSFRRIRVETGKMEAYFSEEVMSEIQQLTTDLVPTVGLERDKAQARAGFPFHMCCEGPLEPKPMMALENVDIGEICLNVWVRVRLNRLPSIVCAFVRFSTLLSSRLEADGVRIQLDRQSPFRERNKGSISALGMQLLSTYKPLVIQSLGSLHWNSNLVAGGMLSRHFWKPKSRKCGPPAQRSMKMMLDDDVPTMRSTSSMGGAGRSSSSRWPPATPSEAEGLAPKAMSGISLSLYDLERRPAAQDAENSPIHLVSTQRSFRSNGSPVMNLGRSDDPPLVPSLTPAGYRKLAAKRSTAETKHFIRRVARNLGLEVVNEGDLHGIAEWYSGETRSAQSFENLRKELLDKSQERSCKWLRRSPSNL